MSHNLDTTEGVTSFINSRDDAWHGLGESVNGTFSAEDAMSVGHLGNWNVRKMPLLAQVDPGTLLEVPDRFAVVRDNPVAQDRIDVLSTVGDRYHVMQNEELADLLNLIVDESGAHFETAGAINGGRQVFLTMKLPSYLKVGGVDQVDQYLAALTSHDGSLANTIMVTPIRVVCQNTLNIGLREAKSVMKVRHTKGASAALAAQARATLTFSDHYLDAFTADAEKMIQTTLTQSQFTEIIEDAFGADEEAPAASQTRAENKIHQLEWLFAEADTQAAVRGTVWAGFNALTEWFDHYSPTRLSATSSETEDSSRQRRAILDTGFKDRAYSMMMAQV